MKLKIRLTFVAADAVCLLISFFVPYLLRYNRLTMGDFFRLPFVLPELWLPDLALYSLIYLFWGVLFLVRTHHYGLFSPTPHLSYLDEIFQVLKAALFSAVLSAGAVFFFQVKIYSRLVFVANFAAGVVLITLWRSAKKSVVRRAVRDGKDNRKVLIAGAGRVGRLLAGEIGSNPYLGLEVAGFLDDHRTGEVDSLPVLGKWADLEAVVRRHFINEVLISNPSDRFSVSRVIKDCQRMGVGVRLVPNLISLTTEEVEAGFIGRVPLLGYHRHRPHASELALKRAFDFIVASFLLIILSPLLAAIALLIKLDSRGPVLYVSDRCGKDGRVFKFLKFRSMVAGADKLLSRLKDRDETDGPIFKMRRDPRVTRVGRWLRRFSLDELPQLVNVVKGDMSLVGPRPPTPEEVKKYAYWQLRRLEIRPGITCIWQVKGRSDVSFRRWMKYDLFYIENWSFWLDLKIIFQTIGAVISGRGAY